MERSQDKAEKINLSDKHSGDDTVVIGLQGHSFCLGVKVVPFSMHNCCRKVPQFFTQLLKIQQKVCF